MVLEEGESNEDWLRAVYPELKEMAARLLRRERPDHTLQRTALVHEAFLRLFGVCPGRNLSEGEFLLVAARKMRQILIDHARRRKSIKRGRDFTRIELIETTLAFENTEEPLLALDQALERLGTVDPRALSVVELKFFFGYTNGEAAEILGISDGTVESDWQFARSWLFGMLKHRGVGPSGLDPGHEP